MNTILPSSKKILLALAALLIGVGWIYAQALPGYWLYDDWPNLAGLSEVHDLASSGHFVLSGIAGELGRPISLLTFVFQANAWDQDPAAMLRVNFLIHLLAVLACYTFATGLAQLHIEHDVLYKSRWIGLLTSSLWGLSPFLATTHLMVIQRMTSLSGLFVLLGLSAFVWAHIYNTRNQHRRTQILLVAGLGLMTLLATLSKENGALLPLLACLTMWTWIPKDHRLKHKSHQLTILFLAIIPTILLAGYLIQGLVETLLRGTYGPRRDFTPSERLMTQPLILLDYLHMLFVPRISAISPFMDNFPASQGWLSPPQTLFASIFWTIALTTSLFFKNKFPAIAFGLLFFLFGHLLESTYIGLEMYFAHRNYIPAVGLYFSLAYSVVASSGSLSRFFRTGLLLYITFFAGTLLQTTNEWNNKILNGISWLNHNPHSVRAAQFLANQYNSAGHYEASRSVLDTAASENPDNILLQIQSLNNCVNSEATFHQKKEQAIIRLRSTPILNSLATYELSQLAEHEPISPLCPPRTPEVIIELAEALLNNPTYNKNQFSLAKLHLAKAFSYSHLNRDKEAAINFIESFHHRPDLDVAFYGAALLANLGDYQAAYDFLNEVEATPPNQPLAAEIWNKRLSSYWEIISKSQLIDRNKKYYE